MRRLAMVMLAGALALTTSCDVVEVPGVGQPRACTMIGCESQVRFALTDVDLRAGVAYDVSVCVDDVCERGSLQVGAGSGGSAVVAGQLSLDVRRDLVTFTLGDATLDGDHDVSLEVRDESGELVVATRGVTAFERAEPNGPGCEPVCWQVTIEV